MALAHNTTGGFVIDVVRSPAASFVTEQRIAQVSYNGYTTAANSVIITSTANATYGLVWAVSIAGQPLTNYNNFAGLNARFVVEDIGPLTNNPPAS